MIAPKPWDPYPREVTKALKAAMDERDGKVCAWHGSSCGTETLVPHHRVNRGSGGRRSLNRLSNLVWLCSVVNGLIESDSEWAERARNLGIKLSGHDEPSGKLIDHAVHGPCWLDDDGTVLTQAEAIERVGF